ncbi:hypothetical protein O6P43_008580 [Quillaja saponaria]|uniref:Uncharacterized protein n=1 Tax=Quillaja saponaria TaxID=32244 RepID=A0AAD7M5J4_QUISA|nr:hypothetical protein O6P43_008580 [Quillaja saponaria]
MGGIDTQIRLGRIVIVIIFMLVSQNLLVLVLAKTNHSFSLTSQQIPIAQPHDVHQYVSPKPSPWLKEQENIIPEAVKKTCLEFCTVHVQAKHKNFVDRFTCFNCLIRCFAGHDPNLANKFRFEP